MKNRPHKGAGFVGVTSDHADSKIIAFPRRHRPPLTISQHVAHYRAQRAPRGAYKTPLQNDWSPAHGR